MTMKARKKQSVHIIFENPESGKRKAARKAAFSGKRALSAALIGALLVTGVGLTVSPAKTASAKQSLVHIQQIKADLQAAGNTKALKMLEIVPRSSGENAGLPLTGQFGWLVEGQEPVRFDETLTSLTGNETSTGREVRTDFAKNYLGGLQKLGLMGAAGSKADAYPLSLLASYQEYYPWELSAEDQTSGAYKIIDFSVSPESVYAKVKAEPASADQAEFRVDVSAFKVQQGGGYAQSIDSVVSSADLDPNADLSDVIFWHPEFNPLDTSKYTTYDSLKTLPANGVFCRPQGSDDPNAWVFTSPTTSGWNKAMEYATVTSYASSAADVKLGTEVGKAGGPASLDDGWYAVTGQIIKATDASLTNWLAPDKKPDRFIYVGKNHGGTYKLAIDGKSYSAAKSGNMAELVAPAVYYQGGFKNNNWFLRYVLDYDEEEAGDDEAALETMLTALAGRIEVDTVAAPDVRVSGNAEAGQSSAIGAYSLIAVTTGMNLAGNSSDFGNAAAYTSADILSDGTGLSAESEAGDYPDDAVAEYIGNIYAGCGAHGMKKPVVFDESIQRAAGSTNIGKLLTAMMQKEFYTGEDNEAAETGLLDQAAAMRSDERGYNCGYVFDNVFCFKADGNAGDAGKRAGISGPAFHSAYPAVYYNTPEAAFYPVYNEIIKENALRQRQNDGTALLDKEVSEASVIRYILNFTGRRPTNTKDHIHILDIEPDNHSEITVDGTPGGTASARVLSWLENYYAAYDPELENEEYVKITTLPVAEFIGKIEDITENYDIVYIGGDTRDYAHRDEAGVQITDFNDDSMDGLVYYNIGDTITTSSHMSMGMLDTDYNNNADSLKLDTNQQYRYSANDLTAEKMRALKEFASLGFPVIVSDALTDLPANAFYDTPPMDGMNVVYVKIPNDDSWRGKPVYCKAWGKTGNEGKGDVCTRVSGDIYKFTWPDSAGYSGLLFDNGEWNGTNQTVNIGGKGNTKYPLVSGYLYDFSANYIYRSKDDRNGKYCPAEPCRMANVLTDASFVNISTDRVDNSSRMYEALKSVWDQENVYAAAYADLNPATVFTQANLSKPELQFVDTADAEGNQGEPKAYDGTSAETRAASSLTPTDDLQGYVWDCTIRIVNSTDADPQNTTYSVSLFVDQNSDGRFSEGEEINDLDAEQLTGSLSENGTFSEEKTGEAAADSLKGALTAKEAPVYHISRVFPKNVLQGIVPWKLVVTQNGAGSFHDSQEGFSYAHMEGSEPQSIRILQINSDYYFKDKSHYEKYGEDSDGLPTYNLEAGQIAYEDDASLKDGDKGSADKKYARYLKAISDDFDIRIETVYPGSVSQNNYQGKFKGEDKKIDLSRYTREDDAWKTYPANYSEENKRGKETGLTSTNFNSWGKDNYKWIFAQYDMIILGFSDCWMNLSPDAANAIVDYANEGKSVLFSHDTSSYISVKSNDLFKKTWPANSGSHTYFGFAVNSILRSRLQMDRYGISDLTERNITNPWNKDTFGGTVYNGQAKNWRSGLLAKGQTYSQSDSLPSALTEAGYDVAWRPKSGTGWDETAGQETGRSTVTQVQGLTDFQIAKLNPTEKTKFGRNSGTNYGRTNAVSQVNKGQITSYPYNVNTEAFEAGSPMTASLPDAIRNNKDVSDVNNVLDVSTTHYQYFQLNMNQDDIVVWYCLANCPAYSGATNNYDVVPNDVANSYYIYSAGNVTYTGAGHDAKVTDNEAKLFVNTMVAALRTGRTAPKGGFYSSADSTVPVQEMVIANGDSQTGELGYKTDNDGKKPDESSEIYVSQDPTVTISGSGSARVYFRVDDQNIDADKQTGVYITLPYGNGNRKALNTGKAAPTGTYGRDKTSYTVAWEQVTVPVYEAKTGNQVDPSSADYKGLKSGMMYYFDIPDEALSAIVNAKKDEDRTITMVPYTYFKSGGTAKFMEGEYKLRVKLTNLLPIG